MTILGLLLGLLLACLVYWAATRLMDAFGVGDPVRTVVIVVLVILLVLWLLRMAGIAVPGIR